MSEKRPELRRPATAVLLACLMCLAPAACGGSSNPAATTGTVDTPAAASSSGAASGPASPGSTTARSPAAKRAAGARAAAARTQFDKALASYSSCLSANGVKLPAANGGRAFSLKGVDTKSPAFKAAAAKCRGVLNAAFRAAAPPKSALASPPRAPSGGQTSGTPAAPLRVPISAALLAQEKRFSACIRTQGIATFPEPKAGGGWDLAAAHLNTSDPRFRTAESNCSSILDPTNRHG